MKKSIFTILAMTLLSCSSNLNKKIELTAYNETIEAIKKDNSVYTDEDFVTASKELDKHSYKAMQNGKNTLNITYQQLLNTAQEINSKKLLELENYNKELQKLKNVIDVKLANGKFVDISSVSPQYPNGYALTVKLASTADRTVTAIKGKVILLNQKNEKLLTYAIEENITLKPNKKLKADDSTIIFEDDNLTELKALPFDNIIQEWHPEVIIFEDGTRMDAPKRPQ